MRRIITDDLVEWRDDPNKRPLLVQGIPQCGKTFLLKEFGARFYKDVLYFDFEEDLNLSGFFERNLDPQRIIKDISLFRGKDILPESTLIIFDGIHHCERALAALERFSDEMQKYHILAASTILDLSLPKIETITLFPMNFYEFLLALNSMLAMHLKESAFQDDALKTFSTQLEEMFRDYQIVGGMPEVVQSWIDDKSIEMVDKLQSRIINSYKSSFAKFKPISTTPKYNALWNAIPAQLAKENRKFIFSKVKKSWRAKDLEDALYKLVRSGLVHKVEHIEKPDIPLSSYVEHTHFKLYMCDVGLLRSTASIPASVILDTSGKYKEIKGAMVENIVCCELKRIYQSDLYYWSAENPGRAEVEFIVQDGSTIIPIVAKAGSASRTRSLLQYTVKFKPEKSVLTSMDNDKNDILPLYAFWNLKEWLKLNTAN